MNKDSLFRTLGVFALTVCLICFLVWLGEYSGRIAIASGSAGILLLLFDTYHQA